MERPDTPMTLRLSVDTGGGPGEGRLCSLYEWLTGEELLRGSVTLRRSTPTAGTMGAALEAITVAVGSGGIVGVLARSVATWVIQGRRSDVKVSVVAGDGRRVEVDVRRARDPEAVMRQVADLTRCAKDESDG